MRDEITKWIPTVVPLVIVIMIGLVGYGKLQASVTNNGRAISTIEGQLTTMADLLSRIDERTGGVSAGRHKE